jgi:hydrogenase maturation protease
MKTLNKEETALRTLILGIGNTLLSDEGVGVHVVQHLARRHPDEAGLTYLDGGTLSFTLAGDIADHENLIVIDAARFGEPPGTVRVMEDEAMDRYLGKAHLSVHEVGLSDLMDMSRLADHLPVRRALVGIEPKSLDWGDVPSPEVAPAVEVAAERVLELVRRWRASQAD